MMIRRVHCQLRRFSTSSSASSFIKTLFGGEVEIPAAFPYPYIDKPEYERFQEKFLTHYKDVTSAEFPKQFSDSESKQNRSKLIDHLVKDNVIGQSIPTDYGGLGLPTIHSCLLNELYSVDMSVIPMLQSHVAMASKIISLIGTEEQQMEYLSKLSTGHLMASVAFTEDKVESDCSAFVTDAVLSGDGEHYLINGAKTFVVNEGNVGLFVVIAKTGVKDDLKMPGYEGFLTAFLIDGDLPGVSVENQEPAFATDIKFSRLVLEDVKVSRSKILGVAGKGYEVLQRMIQHGNVLVSTCLSSAVRRVMVPLAEHCGVTKLRGRKLKDMSIYQERFGRMSGYLHGMESLAYLTAGMLDTDPMKDLSMEANATKIYCVEKAVAVATEAIQLAALTGFSRTKPFDKLLRDIMIHTIYLEPIIEMKVRLAQSGLEHIADKQSVLIDKFINSSSNPKAIYTKRWNDFKFGFLKKDVNLGLLGKEKYGYLMDVEVPYIHHSFREVTVSLEFLIRSINSVSVELLAEMKKKKYHKRQVELCYLSDAIIDIYTMLAVLSRASRAVVLGHRNSHHEFALANTFVVNQLTKAEENFLKFREYNLLQGRVTLGKDVLENRGYLPSHPLTPDVV